MKHIFLLPIILCLSACVMWRDYDDIKSVEDKVYARSVYGAGYQVVLGMLAHPMPEEFYDISTCFEDSVRSQERTMLEAFVIGAHPLDRVCKQYQGVDLVKAEKSILDCFLKDNEGYMHPWIQKNPSEKCRKFIKLISLEN